MAILFSERVRETSITTGTGDLTLAGAATGFGTFNTAYGTGSGNTFQYSIVDTATGDYETGITYLSAATTLVRGGAQTVLKSSNSNNPVSFGAGTKDVFSSISARQMQSARMEVLRWYCTTPEGNVEVGTNLARLILPAAFFCTEVDAYCQTAPTGSELILDLNDDGSSVLSTKLTIDVAEKDSSSAAVPSVISSATWAAFSVMSVDVDTADSSDTAAGLEVRAMGYYLTGV